MISDKKWKYQWVARNWESDEVRCVTDDNKRSPREEGKTVCKLSTATQQWESQNKNMVSIQRPCTCIFMSLLLNSTTCSCTVLPFSPMSTTETSAHYLMARARAQHHHPQTLMYRSRESGFKVWPHNFVFHTCRGQHRNQNQRSVLSLLVRSIRGLSIHFRCLSRLSWEEGAKQRRPNALCSSLSTVTNRFPYCLHWWLCLYQFPLRPDPSTR